MLVKVKLDTMIKNGKQGKVGKISVKTDEAVKIGDKLLQVESVKGNTVVKSKINGTVKNILVSEGQTIKLGEAIAEIEKE